MSLMNLEPLAAQAANRMVDPADAKTSENTLTKSLAVLTEQGVYAFGLFLATRGRDKEKNSVKLIDQHIRQLLKDARLYQDSQPDMASYYRSISAQQDKETSTDALRRLLLTKQLMEVTLTYARYHAKAFDKAAS
jgi:vacuolar-type H+-ATPase catalytic subunit A/Vma1